MVMDVSQIPTELIEQENQRRVKNNVMRAVMPLFDFQNRMKEVHPEITDDAINGISQGLNNGYKDIDEYQTLANIRRPQSQEEIDLARQGQFNLPEQNNQAIVNSILGKVKGGLSDIAAGYKDNTMNGFNLGNLQADPNKSGWQRLGEALGTGQRLLSNPALQGLIAGAIYGKQQGDVGEGLKYGIDWAQNKATQNYYADKLNQPRRIIGGFTKEDYNADVLSKYRDTMADNAELKVQAMLDRYVPTMGDFALARKVSGDWTQEQYDEFINRPDFEPTRRISLASIKEMTNHDYKNKDIKLKEEDTASKIERRKVQNANDTKRTNTNAIKALNKNGNNKIDSTTIKMKEKLLKAQRDAAISEVKSNQTLYPDLGQSKINEIESNYNKQLQQLYSTYSNTGNSAQKPTTTNNNGRQQASGVTKNGTKYRIIN